MGKQIRHTRTSKTGKRFLAGKGNVGTTEKRMMRKYYVVDTTPVVQPSGFYQGLIGTHSDRKTLHKNSKVLYEGTNPVMANRIFRQANSGKPYDERNTMIYMGVVGKEMAVLHKVCR